MSVLETFYFAFRSDAKDVVKGTQDALKSANALDKGLLDNKQAADALSKSFLTSIRRAGQRLSGILTIGSLASQTIREAAQSEELGRFSERLDQNIEEVSTWGKIIEHTGGSAAGFRSTLEGLTNTLTEFSITGGGAAAETFARLEINAFKANGQLKTAFELLPEIADSFQNISREESVNLGKRLGLDNATILLLQRGRDHVEQMIRRQERLGIVTREDTEIVSEFNMVWRDTRTAFDSLVRRIGFNLLPALSSVFTGVQNVLIFMRENGGIISEMFKAGALGLTLYYLPALKKASVSIAAFGLKAAAALIPFALKAGAIALIGIVIDDVIGYFRGYESLTGRIIESNKEAIESFKEFFTDIKDRGLQSFKDLKAGAIDYINQARALVGLDPIGGENKPAYVIPNPTGSDAPFLTDEGVMAVDRASHRSDAPFLAPELIQLLDQASQNNALVSSGNPSLLAQHNSQTQQTSASVSISAINVDARGDNSDQISAKIGSSMENAMENVIGNMSTAIQG